MDIYINSIRNKNISLCRRTKLPITVQGSHENALSNIALPVELSSFTAIGQGRDVNLSWETKTEVSSSKFLVERTAQSTQNWVSVGEVAASGNSNSTKEYSFTDKKLNSGKYIYRLKMVDADELTDTAMK